MPLTPRVKGLMGVQGLTALITTGVIVARAVGFCPLLGYPTRRLRTQLQSAAG